MAKKRVNRLNSLLKEVISEVIRREVRNPQITEFISVTQVDITRDLRQAKVYVSVIGNAQEKTTVLKALRSAAGFISSAAAKKVTMRFFPTLTFLIDDSVDKQMRVEELLKDIYDKENERKHHRGDTSC
ncbi:MAG: 30S ribosome-binding factor RbfA [Waddliaceae bacterium]